MMMKVDLVELMAMAPNHLAETLLAICLDPVEEVWAPQGPVGLLVMDQRQTQDRVQVATPIIFQEHSGQRGRIGCHLQQSQIIAQGRASARD
jgi:hypothetical protein